MALVEDHPDTLHVVAPSAPIRRVTAPDALVPDIFELCAAAAAIGAALIAGRSVELSLAGDVGGAATLALGFAGLLALEALAVHCGAWRDAARSFDDGRPHGRLRVATGFACLAFAGWMHAPAAASAAAALFVMAMAARTAAHLRAMAVAAADHERARASSDFATARANAARIKAVGLELAFARRIEAALDRAAPALARATMADALRGKLLASAGPVAAVAGAATALVVATPTQGEFAALVLLCARAGAALYRRAPRAAEASA